MYGPNGGAGGGTLAYTGAGLTIAGASIGSISLAIIAGIVTVFAFAVWRVGRQR